jgi:hypothetical protein
MQQENGTNPDNADQKTKLRQATIIDNTIAGVSIVMGIWFFLVGKPFLLLFIAGLLIPITIVFYYRYYDGLLRMTTSGGRADSRMCMAPMSILITGVTMVWRVIKDYQLIDFKPLLICIGIGAIATLILFFVGTRRVNKYEDLRYLIPGAIVYSLIYWLGISITVNCFFDTAKPEYYKSPVVNKWISSGRGGRPHFKVQSWGIQKTDNILNVDYDLYKKTDVGDSILVTYRPGLMGAGWYSVSQ